jgi:hypothetical protein
MKKISTMIFAVLFTANMMAQVPNYVPTNGLVGWWPFNGNANDESGNNHSGTVSGATLTTDRFGNSNKAYSFNGVSDFISCNNYDYSINSSLSLSFWVKISNITSSTAQYLISKGIDNNGGFNFNFNNNPPAFYGGFGIGTANVVGDVFNVGEPAPQNSWSHICFIYNGNQMNLYHNGVLTESQVFNNGFFNSTSLLFFGMHNYSGFPNSVSRFSPHSSNQ